MRRSESIRLLWSNCAASTERHNSVIHTHTHTSTHRHISVENDSAMRSIGNKTKIRSPVYFHNFVLLLLLQLVSPLQSIRIVYRNKGEANNSSNNNNDDKKVCNCTGSIVANPMQWKLKYTSNAIETNDRLMFVVHFIFLRFFFSSFFSSLIHSSLAGLFGRSFVHSFVSVSVMSFVCYLRFYCNLKCHCCLAMAIQTCTLYSVHCTPLTLAAMQFISPGWKIRFRFHLEIVRLSSNNTQHRAPMIMVTMNKTPPHRTILHNICIWIYVCNASNVFRCPETFFAVNSFWVRFHSVNSIQTNLFVCHRNFSGDTEKKNTHTKQTRDTLWSQMELTMRWWHTHTLTATNEFWWEIYVFARRL